MNESPFPFSSKTDFRVYTETRGAVMQAELKSTLTRNSLKHLVLSRDAETWATAHLTHACFQSLGTVYFPDWRIKMGEKPTRDKFHGWQGNIFNRVQLPSSEILSHTSHVSLVTKPLAKYFTFIRDTFIWACKHMAVLQHADPAILLTSFCFGGWERLNCAHINFPALHLTPASFGAENLWLCTARVIYSPQGRNVFSQFGTHTQDKKQTKKNNTQSKYIRHLW